MYILGINLSHHASICLFEDEKNIFYLEYDRISGRKEDQFQLFDEIRCLKNILKYTSHLEHVIFSSFGKEIYNQCSDNLMIDHLKYKLDEYGIIYDNVHFFNEHHLYHAANAFYSSNFDEAAALVLDGGGFTYNDYISLREIESMYYFSNIKCNTIKKHYSRSDIFFSDRPEKHKENVIFSSTLSCGGLFNSLSRSTALEAGKLMGLSSYGDEKNIETGSWFIYDQECEVWVTDNQKILNSLRNHSQNSQINPGPYGDNLPSQYQLVGDQYSQEKAISDIAKKLQIETKKHTVNLIRQVLDKCQTNNIVLSGGYMLNCVNNYEYIKEFPNVNFYIDPICHDGGTCIGAVKYLWHCILKNKSREPLKTLYLG